MWPPSALKMTYPRHKFYFQVASPNCDMNKNLGQDNCSWALNSEQGILTNGNVEYKLEQQVQEGDIIVSLQPD